MPSNQAKVESVKSGDVMSLVKFDVTVPHEMSSVLTTKSVEHLQLTRCDDIERVMKAIISILAQSNSPGQIGI